MCTVAPAALQYMACSRRHKKSDAATKAEEFAKLHDKYAQSSLELIMSLRGLYIKFGQAAASSPFVPQAYRTKFKQLQSEVPSEDYPLIKQVVEAEFGRPIAETFTYFSETACGAASIGQAHLARLHSGEEVVVKVQYPDAANIFAADMQCLRVLVRLAQPEALPAFSEFESQLALELDYRQELRNLSSIHDAVMPRYADRVAVPRAHPAMCTERVLTMEYLPGPKLEADMRRQMERLGVRIDDNESIREWLQRLDASNQPAEEAEEAAAEGGGSRLGRLAARVLGVDLMLYVMDKALSLRSGRSAADGAVGGVAGGAGGRTQAELRACLASLVEVHGYEMFVSGLFNAECACRAILLT